MNKLYILVIISKLIAQNYQDFKDLSNNSRTNISQ
jgi:hypothetical protein